MRVEFGGRLWIDHPDEAIDLAVFPCASILNQAAQRNLVFFYTALNPPLIPSQAVIDNFTGLEDITMIGYPDALWDSVNNLPLMRAGITATHPKYNFEGGPFFVIDCACFNGSSGSPVFIYNRGSYRDRSGTHMGRERLLLLGILFSGPQHDVEGEVRIVETTPLAKVAVALSKIPNNLGLVIKSSKLMDFEPILRARRDAAPG